MINKITNLIAATYSPLNEDDSLNLELIPKYAAYLKNNKIAGAFVNGSTGDFASLTVPERKLIIESWARNKPDDFFLINHVGHINIELAKELATHSAHLVDAIAALSPYYFKVSSLQSLVDYCREVAASAPNLPFYYYHIPGLSGSDFAMIDFLILAEDQIPNLAGIKFTKNDIIDFRYCKNYKNNKYNILYGVDEMFLAGLPYEANGWVGSTYNHLAPLYHKIIEAFNNGDYKLASQLQTKSMQFVDELNGRGGFNGVAKSFMKILGINCGPSRFPLKTVSNEELNEITQILEKLDIMRFTNN